MPKDYLKVLFLKEFTHELIINHNKLTPKQPRQILIPRAREVQSFTRPLEKIYIKKFTPPIPQKQKSRLNLGKINLLLQDKTITYIECPGENKNLIIKRGQEPEQETKISLTKSEINEIINDFSRVSKIPTEQGAFKVIISNLLFSAIISDLISSRFIILRRIPPKRLN